MPINVKCQVFTPQEYAQHILDKIGYVDDLLEKKVVENSCGDGNILLEIVERLVSSATAEGYSLSDIKCALESNIWAYEVDQTHINNCLYRLNELVGRWGIKDVSWKVLNEDFLRVGVENEFDFVIGNPPYIAYKDIEYDDRSFLKFTYTSCAVGKFDYCYAFIEASLKALKSGGRLGYLIPSNIFKNEFGENLRRCILPHITSIFDYTSQKLFHGKLTSSAIIIGKKDNNQKYVHYYDIVKKRKIKLQKKNLDGKWIFSQPCNNLEATVKFGDYFHAANTIATLYNDAYLLVGYIENCDCIQIDNHCIEKKLVKKAASPRSLNRGQGELIIFPYFYESNVLRKYSCDEFERLFPRGTQYLQQFKVQLNDRNSDRGISWFEYGRSQALVHMNQPKILISTLITKKVKTYLLDEDTIPTAGIYIIPKSSVDLKTVFRILQSECFYRYVESIGIIANGHSYRINARDINNFHFPKKLLEN